MFPFFLIALQLFLSGPIIFSLRAEDRSFALLSEEERTWLNQNADRLTLFFNVEFPPIEFSSSNGDFIGLGADVIALIESRLGVAFIKIPSDDWNEHLAALERGDCAIAPVIVCNEERERYAFFTTPYASAPVVMIAANKAWTNLTFDDLAGKRVAVVSGFVTEKYMRDRVHGRFEIVTVNNVSEGLYDVSFGEVDVLVENLAVAAYHIEKEGIPNLHVAGVTDYSFDWSVGISRKHPLLFNAIQKALADISDDELNAIRKRWISLSVSKGLSPETILILKLAALFTALLVLSLTLITVILKRRLREKLSSLKQTQDELRESEQRYARAISATTDAIWEWNLQTGHLYVSPRWYEILGYSNQELEMTIESWNDHCHPDDREKTNDAIRRMFDASDSIKFVTEYRMRAKDGSWKWILMRGDVVEWDENGKPLILSGTNTDITERKKLETRLIQSQKMEAIGRLAGGIAHDFNNMLGVIIGYAELAMDEADPTGPIPSKLDEILKASDRAANLTRQLLAFACQQTIHPKVIDLNETIDGMFKMSQRLIGEDITLSWLPGEELWWVKIDPTQIDQILINMCVNARDAIQGCGTITIETKNISIDDSFCRSHPDSLPGDYVTIAISDNGCGMDKETQMQIFEPFFTTKGVGKGTGLGLATVYGIVQQNNGFINIDSEVGLGSTFTIFIPRFQGELLTELNSIRREIPRGEGETILIVEDDFLLLKMAQSILETQGYHVLFASTPSEAVRLTEKHPSVIHLLLTDVIMPEMNGRDLAQLLLTSYPNLKCLFMSGYTSDVIDHHGVLKDDVQFIQKPFSVQDLAFKVHETLKRF